MKTDYRITRAAKYFLLLMFAAVFIPVQIACDGGNEAKGDSTGELPAVNLADLLDTDDLWGTGRQLGDALVAGAAGFEKNPGALAYFRFAYMAGVAGAEDAVSKVKEHAMSRAWPAPEELISDPLFAAKMLDDAQALYNLKKADPEAQWKELDSAYNGITGMDLPDLNERLAMNEDNATRYNYDAAGFFSEVDHEASICGFVTAYGLGETAGFTPATVLLSRFGHWWDEIPENADGEPDLLGLLDTYDVVTYPVALDLEYRSISDPLLYSAMAEILTAYRDALDIESIKDGVETLANKHRAVEQLCVMARLFRRMYAFTDDDEFLESAEGIMREIGPMCLSADSGLVLSYAYALTHVVEPALHVVIVGPSNDPAWAELARLSRERYEPRLALMPLDGKRDVELIEEIGYYATSKPSCFVCVDTNCFKPINDPDELENMFEKAYEDIKEARAERAEKTEDENE
jgi:hypothetical protein